MASNLYDSELVSSISSSDIKLDPTAFYTPTSAPFNQISNLQQQSQQPQLRQQLQQQIQQEDQQFYSHTAPGSYGNLNGSFLSSIEIPSPPPLTPDTSTVSIMNPSYMGGYSQLPLTSQYGEYYGSSSNGYASQQIPRSLDESYNLMLRYNFSSPSHPGSEYQQSPVPSPHSSHHGLLVDSEWYTSGQHQYLSRSHSPHSLAHHQSASIKDEGEDIEDQKVELPYAKLIHKALMEAPNHSMSLQDIYKWFMENTEKGSSSGSGWRNSIRHNLSMNQAFRKSDKNAISSPTDGTPKKTSEWVLEPWAVADGVTPTTRYRQKVARKTAHRNASNINTSRQSAGKKGGNMAGRTKALRTREMTRLRSEQGSREASVSRDYERDYYGRSNSKRQCTSDAFALGRNSPPMEDPITPTASMANGPYYQVGTNYEDLEREYRLQDVQGVYPEDLYNEPIFSNQAMPKYGNGGLEYNDAWVATE